MRILACNAGSTSLKYQLFDMPGEQVLCKGKIERIGEPDGALLTLEVGGRRLADVQPVPIHSRPESTRLLLESLVRYGVLNDLSELDGVGFKTVHGGAISGSRLIDDETLDALERYITVAPLHNRVYVQAIRSFMETVPELPRVAVFETAFHETMPEHARIYGIPYEWTERYGIRRYGFHGASHRYISQRLPALMGHPSPEGLKLISCHLGGSSSLCAIKDGRSLEASQGFSPQSGIIMGTRNGDLDVYALFHLLSQGLSVSEIDDALYSHGGIAGISGIGEDMRTLEQAAKTGHARAKLALDVFCHDVKKYLGAYWAVLDGADAVVFTGGIGENSAYLRRQICDGLGCLGIRLDPTRNAQGALERRISPAGAPVEVWVVPTDEEIIVARETAQVLSNGESGSSFQYKAEGA